MCLIESSSTISSSLQKRLPDYLSKTVVNNVGPTLLTIRKANPVNFTPDVKYVLDHMGLILPKEVVAQIISLYMMNSIACTQAMSKWGIARGKYFRICYIISERLSNYHNYLADTAFRLRIPKWISNNENEVTRLYKTLSGLNDYVENSYIEHINGFSSNWSSQRHRKNKITLIRLPEEKIYLSGRRLDYKSAVDWFKYNQGKVKRRMQLELASKVTHGFIKNTEVLDCSHDYEQLTNLLYDDAQHTVNGVLKQAEKMKVKDERERKPKKSECRSTRQLVLFKSSKTNMSDIDKKAEGTALRYLRGDPPFTEEEEDLWPIIASYPCQERFFIEGLVAEQYYSNLGKLGEDIGLEMRRKRNQLARMGIFDFRCDLSFHAYDRFMKHHYKGFDLSNQIPKWSPAKKWFELSNTYRPHHSEYLQAVLRDKIKEGSHVNLLQFYKNNAISTKSYIDLSLMQRLSRKIAKRSGRIVLDKHQFCMNMINDLNQQLPDLMSAAHAKVRYRKVTEEVFEKYLSQTQGIGNLGFFEESLRYLEAERFRKVARWEIKTNMGMNTMKEKREEFDKCSVHLNRAMLALNDLIRYRMPPEDFSDRAYTIRESLLEIDTIIPEIPKMGVTMESHLSYSLLWGPTYMIFINQLIVFLIKFMKTFKVRKGYSDPHLRICSKPLREIETLILLRHRNSWDLIETGKVYIKSNKKVLRAGDIDPEIDKFLKKAQAEIGKVDLGKALRDIRLRRSGVGYEARDNRREMGVVKPLTENYQYMVARALSVEKYLFRKEETMRFVNMKITFMKRKESKSISQGMLSLLELALEDNSARNIEVNSSYNNVIQLFLPKHMNI